jgi:beta-N-acetylhexosaminidase
LSTRRTDRSAGPTPRAVFFGSSGPSLSADERAFFRASDPAGYILFRRNIESAGQVEALVAAFRECVGRADAPVLIDQEGGRVARLPSPPWRKAPPAAVFGEIAAADPTRGARAAHLNALLIGADLRALGINVDCAPVLDLPVDGAHGIIGDRAFAADPALVARLGRAAGEGFLAAGVIPVIKHIPGHGRARVDSHESLPVVETALDILRASDFAPFRALADMPMAMTAHIVYTAIDPTQPATTSPAVIGPVIRGEIGFDGLLMSDDICMKALAGTLAERTRAVIDAGCDVVLHCNGDLAEMEAVAASAPPLSESGARRLAGALGRVAGRPMPDAAAAQRELDEILANRVA